MEKKDSQVQATAGENRREFLKRSAALGAAGATGFPALALGKSQTADPIRVGVIGCGGRGTGAALNILRAQTNVIYPPPRNGYHTEDAVSGARAEADDVQIVALADLFRDRLDHCREQIRRVGRDVPDNRCFVGFDACARVMDLKEVDYVILATPPHFRPRELRAAVDAGKHVFMEKPVAVDPVGVRSILESGELAARKGLGIVAGTQRRHQADIIETVRRLHEGAIGKILEARAYFNIGSIWAIPREPGWTDVEAQLRNWNYYTWLSGDIIVEQHIHNLDLINWVMQSHPVRAFGMGGRASKEGEDFGHIFDHFAIEYEYPNGARLFSQNCQIDSWTSRVGAAVLGSEGTSNCLNQIEGKASWKYEGSFRNSYEQEHLDLIASIRRGEPLNEARAVAEATMTGIIGREAAYSGQVIEWDAAMKSELSLMPLKEYQFGDMPFPEVVNPSRYTFSQA